MDADYDLELERVAREINKHRYKRVLLQFPDGLKPRALEVVDELESRTRAEFFIWLGSCYGACDVPQISKEIGIDLIVQFGHSAWKASQAF